MLAGQTYIICGLSRLAVRVSRRLVANHAEVTIVQTNHTSDRFSGLLDSEVRLVDGADREDLAEILRSAGVARAHCLLALSEDDLDNLRATVAAREVAPDLPVVLRAFDPALAQGLEQGLNIRRAYSVSALAAPAFVVAACGDRVIETLRLGDGEVPICEAVIRSHSPAVGMSAKEIETRFACLMLAHKGADGWKMIESGQSGLPLAPGDKVLIGGLLAPVLDFIGRNATLSPVLSRKSRPTKRPARKRVALHRPRFVLRHTRLPVVALSLMTLLVISVIVFSVALKLRVVDAIYFVITTATTTGYGDISLKDAPDWLKLFGCMIMVSGGALLGVLFSYLSAVATTERLEEMMGRRAGRMHGHVVVAGLGNVGYRVVRHLMDMGWDVAAIELKENARFAEALRERVPVLAGDARLSESLERAAVDRASAFIACTNDDLANIQACLHAQRLSPTIRTVARVYEDALAESLTTAFKIDEALSASQVATGAFFGAATDERAIRPIKVDGLELLAYRVTIDQGETMEQARRDPVVQMLAIHRRDGALLAPRDAVQPLAPGDQVIVCGPALSVRERVGGASGLNHVVNDSSKTAMAEKP